MAFSHRFLCAFAVALCLPLAARAEEKPKPKPKLIDYEAELNDKLGKGITPDKNACALLWKALGPTPEGGAGMPPEFFKRLGIAEPPKEGAYFIALGTFIIDKLQVDRSEIEGIYNQQGWATGRPWAAKDYPFIGVWLKENEKPLAVVLEATKRPEYYNPLVSRKTDKDPGSLIGVLLPSVQKCRELTSALCCRAMLRVNEGKYDEAWADLMACHRLARLVARGGTLIEGLVGYAIEAIVTNAELAYLENAKLTSKQVLERLKDLQGLPPMPTPADKIDLTERYMFMDSLKLVRRGNAVEAPGGLFPGNNQELTPEEKKALESIDWEPALTNGTKWYDRMVAAMRMPNRAERMKALAKIEADLKALKSNATDNIGDLLRLALGKDPGKVVGKQIGDNLITLLLPAVQKVQEANDRVSQVHSNLQVAFAMAAFQKETGRYPAKLDDLAPKYMAKVPGDLFSGVALIYKPTEKGYLFYSVGVNGKDDDGRWYDDEPRGDDPRVRMPLPPLKKE